MDEHSGLLRFGVLLAASTLLLGACGKPPATALTGPTIAQVGNNVSDTDITTNVKTALLQNDTLKGFDIGVVTLKGDVRLVGVLDNQAQIDAALKTARAADGAHSIHDELTLKK